MPQLRQLLALNFFLNSATLQIWQSLYKKVKKLPIQENENSALYKTSSCNLANKK